MNSFGGNIVAHYLAGISHVHDCTADFRCIRADLLRRIDLSSIKAEGYGFQVTLLHAAFGDRARIAEIPVHFADRTRGNSKLGLRDILEFMANAAAIRMMSMHTFFRICVVGVSGVAVNLGLLNLLLSRGLHKYLASPLAVEGSILWSIFLNYKWTSAERARAGSSSRDCALMPCRSCPG